VLLPEPLGPTMAMLLPTLSLRLEIVREPASGCPRYWNVTRSKVMSLVSRAGRSGARQRRSAPCGSAHPAVPECGAPPAADWIDTGMEMHQMGDVVGNFQNALSNVTKVPMVIWPLVAR